MKYTRLCFALIVCLVFSSGCSVLQSLRFSQDKLPWKTSGDILLEEDFTDEMSGWEVVNNVYELKGYSSEGYLISINHKGGRSISTSGLTFSDVLIQVQAEKLTGTNDAYLGVVCRYQDSQNYYRFVITPDGYAGIVKVAEGKSSTLPSGKLTYEHAVKLDDGRNVLDVSCVGSELSLRVNGKLVVTAEDAQFAKGDIGVFGETGQAGAGSFLFNHLIVVKP